MPKPAILWHAEHIRPHSLLSKCGPFKVLLCTLAGIAIGLGLPERSFEETETGGTNAETSYWVTRVLHYPPLADGDAHQEGLAQKAALVRHPALPQQRLEVEQRFEEQHVGLAESFETAARLIQ